MDMSSTIPEFRHKAFLYHSITRLVQLVLSGKTGVLEAVAKLVTGDLTREPALGRRRGDEMCESNLTAAWLAAEAGDTDTLISLLKLGADIDCPAVSSEGEHLSCLQIAAERGHLATIKCLLDAKAKVNRGKNCLLEPCRQGRLDVARMLLAAGEKPDTPGAL